MARASGPRTAAMTLWMLLQVRVCRGGRCWREAGVACHGMRNDPDACLGAACTAMQSVLMMFNGVAILNNDRFLEKCELSQRGEPY